VHSDNTLRYRASRRDCGICPLKPRCCPKEPARKIPRDIHERARDVARSFVGMEGSSSRDVSARKSRCGFQANSEARPSAIARAMWRPIRVHAGSNRAEPSQARQVGRPAATNGGSVCCVTVAGVSKTERKSPAPSSGWQRPASRNRISRLGRPTSRLLQQNRPKAVPVPIPTDLAFQKVPVNWRLPGRGTPRVAPELTPRSPDGPPARGTHDPRAVGVRFQLAAIRPIRRSGPRRADPA
jgi:hypothetical protein